MRMRREKREVRKREKEGEEKKREWEGGWRQRKFKGRVIVFWKRSWLVKRT